MAGQSAEHRSDSALWHQWHRSLLTGSTTSLGWTRRPHGERPDIPNRSSDNGGSLRRYKDTVKVNMKRCGLQPKSLSTAPLDRAQWCTTCQSAIAAFEERPGCRVGQEKGRWQAAGRQHHRHGLLVQQMQQDLLIAEWALCPSAYPSVTQSAVCVRTYDNSQIR